MNLVERALQFFMAQLPAALGAHGGLLVEGVPAPQGTTTVTILNGASLSGVADLRTLGALVGIQPDAAWDTNIVTFQGSYDNAVWTNLRLFGVEVQIPGVVASSLEPVDPMYFLAPRYLKVRSGTAAAPVNQVGDTVITLICRPI